MTIPAAEATGNLTLRPFSIVDSIAFDEAKNRATGVRVIDAETGQAIEYFSKVVFCNASTIGTAAILLKSTSNRFPNGLGNESGEVGHNLMDHHYFVGAMGTYDGLEDRYYEGPAAERRFTFRAIETSLGRKTAAYLRGYGFQGGAGPWRAHRRGERHGVWRRVQGETLQARRLGNDAERLR